MLDGYLLPEVKPGISLEAAAKHIKLLTGSANTEVWFRTFDGAGNAAKLFGTVADQWPEIERLQVEGSNVFVVVNEGGNSDDEINRIRAIFVDADDVPFPSAWHTEPDLIVRRDETHWHAYWRIDDLSVAEFKPAQRSLAERYGTDRVVCNPSRVMRLAGTLHLKDPANPYLVTIEETREEFDPAWGRSKSELLAGLPLAPAKASRKARQATPVKASQETRQAPPGVEFDTETAIERGIALIEKRVEDHGNPVEGQSSDIRTYQMACELKDMGLSPETIHALLMGYWAPHFDSGWIRQKVESAFRNGQNEPGCNPQPTTAETFETYLATHPPEQQTAESWHQYVREKTSLSNWLTRDIKPMDWLLGEVIATSTRMMLYAPTGLGKTNICLALSAHLAARKDFLHWHVHRACRVLYIDGEMPDVLAKLRLQDAVRRLGVDIPKGNLTFVNRADFPDMPPINQVSIANDFKTMPGIDFIEDIIKAVGGVELIVFDNIQSLMTGNMSEGEQWQTVLPWVVQLSQRRIAQIWVHHTGHDDSHAYGDKSREWQLDNVVAMKAVEDPTADICFELDFQKARNRTPDNRADFDKTRITLDGDRWEYQRSATATATLKAAVRKMRLRRAVVSAVYVTTGVNSPPEGFPDFPKGMSGQLIRRRREPNETVLISDGVREAINTIMHEDVAKADIAVALLEAEANGEVVYQDAKTGHHSRAGYIPILPDIQ
jgi:hypothetical protein